MTDIHSHFVYGVDDGARTREEMTALLEESFRQGVTTLYATSHQTPGIEPFPREEYEARLAEARAWAEENHPEMTLLPGAEHLYTPAMDPHLLNHDLMTLGETDCLLVEFVPDAETEDILRLLELCRRSGYTPVLAHIERYRAMRGGLPFRLKREYDVLYQVNAGTVLNPGLLSSLRLRRWLRRGLIDFIASDMHRSPHRPQNLGAALEKLRRERFSLPENPLL